LTFLVAATIFILFLIFSDFRPDASMSGLAKYVPSLSLLLEVTF